MRIAIVAETYLPAINGVTHSIAKIVQHLTANGHTALVIAPSAPGSAEVDAVDAARVVRLPSVPIAGYPSVRIAVGGVARLKAELAAFAPDLAHLASPFELGWRAVRAAEQLGIPTVAVYQTDVPGYIAKYGAPVFERWALQRVSNIHGRASRTLVPSTSARAALERLGVPRIGLWRRGVDTTRFHPARRSADFRREVAPNGERVIGFVGRLAAEKQVGDLAAIADLPGTRLVIVGDGPERAALERLLPRAHFTGALQGERLAAVMASLDLFVHPGELETFCQTIQEAMASGVPVVATGKGGPLDLVESSRTGWLYRPGDLLQLREQVLDLIGDDAKRAAFADAAFHSVQSRTWPVLCELLTATYSDVIENHQLLTLARRGRH